MGSHSEGRVTHGNRKSILPAPCAPVRLGLYLILTMCTQDGGLTCSSLAVLIVHLLQTVYHVVKQCLQQTEITRVVSQIRYLSGTFFKY